MEYVDQEWGSKPYCITLKNGVYTCQYITGGGMNIQFHPPVIISKDLAKMYIKAKSLEKRKTIPAMGNCSSVQIWIKKI